MGRVCVKSHVGNQFPSWNTFKGVVYMYPKAFLETPEGLPISSDVHAHTHSGWS